jgi:acetyl-CoA synthetase
MSTTAFIEARDFLLAHRKEYERAYRDFRWPVLDRFNWALDYFDPMAQGNNRPGLRAAEAARGGENRRAESEFWEEDFPELR